MNYAQFTVRVDRKTGAPELFFYGDGSELTSYTRTEQHAPASVGYMWAHTRPTNPRDAAEIKACDALARHWLALPGAEGVEWVRVSRLARVAARIAGGA